ncbi:DUF4062 domain-containing protein [Janthinobacterium sp. SUN100]|uniref:DUF4062 domain-containing protein n=1 Tax=Janthinobacterium sp. SUN100 TaxID=3004101 RepID=UPI0025B1B981|nr:DUF4062 domain-containing protein [Janthinobacterium sp. SUN100]MDN2700843.1 DUF4062 domain-containing protein [Janthinobacterium sp. SUN100]
MDKRYQVFISSTYSDLTEERKEIMQALLELDAIPAGMELFPAADEDQWTLIKKVIDDCDYYLIVVAGRYGSIGPDKISYTEMEFRYAKESGKPIIGFIHKEPEKIAVGLTESSEEGKAKLNAFKELVKAKPCRFYSSPAELGSQVSRSLVKLISSTPAVGWVRGDMVPSEGAAKEMLDLRNRIDELQIELSTLRTSAPSGTQDLANGDDEIKLHYSFIASSSQYAHMGKSYTSVIALTWDAIFASISPLMIDEASEVEFITGINSLIESESTQDLIKSDPKFGNYNLMSFKLEWDDFQTIKIQLRALGLITKSTRSRSVKDTSTYWTLTPYGDNVMLQLRAIRKD